MRPIFRFSRARALSHLNHTHAHSLTFKRKLVMLYFFSLVLSQVRTTVTTRKRSGNAEETFVTMTYCGPVLTLWGDDDAFLPPETNVEVSLTISLSLCMCGLNENVAQARAHARAEA